MQAFPMNACAVCFCSVLCAEACMQAREQNGTLRLGFSSYLKLRLQF
uniref:Uncharacterized protein n=1 Tax=Anguilla anguilla TaxID=7936 RepID=A0A0E9TVD0_ANGAN